MKFIKKHHVIMKLLALLIAIVLWVFVINENNPEKTVEFQNLPVQLLGQDALLNRTGLAVASIETETITVKVSGNFKSLNNISADNIKVRADLSGYTEPGSYRLAYDVSPPIGITVVSRTPERIPIVLEEIVEKELPVVVQYEGTLGAGISFGDVEIEPAKVRVTGISSVMEKADHALVTLDTSSIVEDYAGSHDYVIVDENDGVLQSAYTKYLDSAVHVSMPVYMTKTVPVEVGIITSGGVPRTSTAVVYEPSEVTVFGSAADVRNLRSFYLGEVSVRDFVLTYNGQFLLTLPEGIEFADEVTETVDVYVYFRDIDTTKVTVKNITLENAPEGVVIDLETSSLDVTVRGNRDKLKNVSADNIRASVDLSGLSTQPGRYTLPAAVKVSVGSYDICGSYTVVVSVSEPTEG